MVSIWASVLSACAHVPVSESDQVLVRETSHVRITESAVQTYSLVVDITLEQFWKLASLQVRDPSVARRLLSTAPREPSKTLQPLNIGFETYRQQLEKVAKVNPLVLFLPHGADPVEVARRQDLVIWPWSPQTPPAFLSGPEVDTLILFEPQNSARDGLQRGGPVARARIASAAGWAGLLLARDAPADIGLRLYGVQPKSWKKGVVFEHTRCMVRSPGVTLVTKLFYQGGVTDSMATLLTEKNWGPCALSADPKLLAATVKQPGGKKAGPPVIIAGSYFLASEPGPFLSDWISVR
jgi:hypothetical protein